MIKLTGLSVRSKSHPNGNIKIEYIGLRPGEKLYEELLIGENPQKTSHEKIQKAQDSFIPFDQLKIDLDNLFTLLEHNKVAEVKAMLSKLVLSFQSNSKIVDHVYYEDQLNLKNDNKIDPIIKDQEKNVIRIKK